MNMPQQKFNFPQSVANQTIDSVGLQRFNFPPRYRLLNEFQILVGSGEIPME